MPPLQRLRQLAPRLLALLIAAGLVLAGAGSLEGHPVLFDLGAWLIILGLVVWFLLHRGSPR
jgi:hypothetical protein